MLTIRQGLTESCTDSMFLHQLSMYLYQENVQWCSKLNLMAFVQLNGLELGETGTEGSATSILDLVHSFEYHLEQ